MRVLIKPDYNSCSKWAAEYIVYKIQQFRPTAEKPFVLRQRSGKPHVG